jgi:hypothetical protein
VYVDQANIESQWPGKPPAENLHWLRDHAGLQPLGTQDDWSLYRVSSCGR